MNKAKMNIMRKYAFVVLAAILFSARPFFSYSKDPVSKTPVSSGLRGNGMEFAENRGQVKDAGRNQRPDILYCGVGGGANVYLRKGGFSYVMIYTEGAEKLAAQEKAMRQKGFDLSRILQSLDSMRSRLNTSVHRVDGDFTGSNKDAKVKQEDPAEGYFNYYPQDITRVNAWNKVTYENIYAFTDVVFHGGRAEGMEYDFIVKPGGNPSDIRITYNGMDELQLTPEGRLKIVTRIGEIKEWMPSVYQETGGKKTLVTARYVKEGRTVSIAVGNYDRSLPLVIDPWTTWITYYGGISADNAYGINTDASGNVLVTGYTYSVDFPLLAGWQMVSSVTGNSLTWTGNTTDAFLVKFNSAGTRQWATYLGGSNIEGGQGVAADASGNVYLLGSTNSSDFLYAQAKSWSGTAANATGVGTVAWGSATNAQGADNSTFSTTANMGLSAVSNYLKATNYGFSLPAGAVVKGVQVIIYWKNNTSTLPLYDNEIDLVVAGTIQTASNKATGLQLLPTAASMTSYGSGVDMWGLSLTQADVQNAGFGVAVSVKRPTSGTSGNTTASIDAATILVYYTLPSFPAAFQPTLAGDRDAFLVKFDGTGARQWATFMGGYTTEGGSSAAVDGSGNVVITGNTMSSDFPVASGFLMSKPGPSWDYDAYVAKFDASGNRLWATYFGGTDVDGSSGVAVDPSGNIFITGQTVSTDLPVAGGYQMNNADNMGWGTSDAYLVKFNSAGARQWATYYGGFAGGYNENGYGVATDASGNVVITGSTSSTDFPVSPGAFQPNNANAPWPYDAFLVKFSAGGARQWATYYGGTTSEYGYGVAVDQASGNIFITGNTNSTDFPIVSASAPQTTNAGSDDNYLVSFDPSGNRLCATYVGGAGQNEVAGIGLHSTYAYIAGFSWTPPGTYCVTAGSFQTVIGGGVDSYIAQLPQGSCTTLPVEWLTFTGRNSGTENILQWSTASETANECFIIERGVDGERFEAIGKEKGAGNSNSLKNYVYTDTDPSIAFGSGFYYRLGQKNYDGTVAYSQVVRVVSHGPGIRVYPVPAEDQLYVELAAAHGKIYSMEVSDPAGKILLRMGAAMSKEVASGSLDVSGLAHGMYFLRVVTSCGEQDVKFTR